MERSNRGIVGNEESLSGNKLVDNIGNIAENARDAVRSVVVIGGGLVGALCVCILAERGYNITMFEKRDDIRKTNVKKGRSINLALSHRGRKALRLIGLEDEVLKNAIPMRGRFLHNEFGDTSSVPYDPVNNQCIYSVGRNFLNETLLNAAEKYTSVDLRFNHSLINADLKNHILQLENLKTNEQIETTADLVVGADGAFSNLRGIMQKTSMFDFSQTYIEHGYLELCVPSERGNRLEPNHLHIWPRGEFMMIALPNQDESWTVTLFMPFKKFEALTDTKKLLQFFLNTFPDALPLIGEKALELTFMNQIPSPLVSIKCGRYDMNDRFLLIGDAAHAMVPFYGQGMNAGFEDCSLLNQILDQTRDDIQKTIKHFTEIRKNDAHAICDLAMYNYLEMRDLVTKPSFKLRKLVDGILGNVLPDIWIPLYNSVCFSHMSYGDCVTNRHWQNKVLLAVSLITAGVIFAVIITFAAFLQ